MEINGWMSSRCALQNSYLAGHVFHWVVRGYNSAFARKKYSLSKYVKAICKFQVMYDNWKKS